MCNKIFYFSKKFIWLTWQQVWRSEKDKKPKISTRSSTGKNSIFIFVDRNVVVLFFLCLKSVLDNHLTQLFATFGHSKQWWKNSKHYCWWSKKGDVCFFEIFGNMPSHLKVYFLTKSKLRLPMSSVTNNFMLTDLIKFSLLKVGASWSSGLHRRLVPERSAVQS